MGFASGRKKGRDLSLRSLCLVLQTQYVTGNIRKSQPGFFIESSLSLKQLRLINECVFLVFWGFFCFLPEKINVLCWSKSVLFSFPFKQKKPF